ncbi:AraC family transcriptional regulator [Tatumella sp. UBA2305]|uniref:AraC family transcriptional regulator n=1 Tax=Tatumella sp. UBA2305 TaxID=1947647 RepID=UPI0025EA746C|nr:AraC family transcriptional regulator [Tatumella sp. UBA2305]
MLTDKQRYTANYQKRITLVLDYIDSHLCEPLLLDNLSKVAHFSVFHFHRQFTACIGIPPGRYIQLMRLRHASYRLAFNPEQKITDIALETGFTHAESFSRAFKQVFGVSPGEFRRQPEWQSWHSQMPAAPQIRREPTMQIAIVTVPDIPVAMLLHQGSPETIHQTAGRFVAWRKTSGYSPVRRCRTFGIAPDDPHNCDPQQFRFMIAGEVSASIPEDNDFGVVNNVIPGGRCATVRHQGSHERLTALAQSLYRDWLPGSGEILRDFPLWFHYHNFIHEVAEHQLVTDIFLPLKD